MKQVINYDNQVVALIVIKNDEKIYLPCLPSTIISDIDFVYMSDDIYLNNYTVTKKQLEEIYEKSNQK